MIIKGTTARDARRLAENLAGTDGHEVAEVVEIRGVVSGSVLGALREIAATVVCTRARDPFYYANIDPYTAATLTPDQWRRAVGLLEETLGLTDQPRVVVRLVKDGREHVQVVWSRIDLDNRRVIPEWQNYSKHEAVARQLEREFGHDRVQGAHEERDSVPRPTRTLSYSEIQQARRSGIDPQAVKAELTALWRQTDTGEAFAAAVTAAGYCLARGDKSPFIVIDAAGEVHSLARRIDGARAADIRARLADIDAASLPDAAGARAIQAARRVPP